MEGNRNEEQEKGAEIRAILSFRDRSEKRMEAIVSYGDPHAIQIAPLLHNGCFILNGSIDLSHKPKKAIKREFVMVLMAFIPAKD